MSQDRKKLDNLNTKNIPSFCPGCGDFGIWSAFKIASQKAGWNATNTAITAGVGCHGHMVNFIDLPAVEGLHGRAVPVACGIKMVSHDTNVFVFTGDGDSLAEGGNHFIHAARRNQNITMILHDNAVYALTTGQTSPRSPKGYKSKSTPQGNVEQPLNPLSLAISAGATYVARVYSGEIDYLAELIIEANEHNGFSLIDVLQPCVTFNKMYTHYFYQKNTYKLDSSHDKTNKQAAFAKSLEWDLNQIPVGVFYHDTTTPSYEDQILQIQNGSILSKEVQKRDITSVMNKYSQNIKTTINSLI